MRRISWFASFRSRTVSFCLLLLLGNAVAWLVFVGPLRSRGESDPHRSKPHARSSTQPLDDLHLIAAVQSNYDWQEGSVSLLLTFNKPVDPNQIFSRLQLLEENAHRVSIHLASHSLTAMSPTIGITTESMPRLEAAEDGAFKISLLRTVVPEGSISLDSLGPTLDVPIATDQRVTAVSDNSARDPSPSIRVRFSAPIDLAAIRPAIAVEPAVPFTIYPAGSNEVTLNGPFKPATRYAVKIAPRAENQDSKVVPRGGVCTVFLPDRRADVWFDHTSGFLSSGGTRRVTVHAMNVTELTVTISKLYDNNLVVWRNLQEERSPYFRRRHHQTDDSSIDKESRVITTKKLILSTTKNQEQQRDLSIDDLLPTEMRGDGIFRIDVAGKSVAGLIGDHVEEDYDDDSATPNATALLTLSDIALTAKHSAGELLVWATSLHSAKPLGGMRIRAFTAENQLAAEAVTDNAGVARLPANSADGHGAEIVLADHQTQLSWLDLRDPPLQSETQTVHGASYARKGYDAFVYADRGVYRPGETVHLRAVVRDSEQKAPHPFPVQFILHGPEERSRGTISPMLDANGSAAWELNIPPEAPTGEWSVAVGLPGDHAEPFGTLQFQVEEFIPDRIHVRAAFEHPNSQPRQSTSKPLQAMVHGDYLFGQPAANLQSDLICRIDPEPFAAPGFSDWSLNDDAAVAEAPAVVHASGVEHRVDNQTLDESGEARAELAVEDLLFQTTTHVNYHGPWRASLTAEVRETGGRAVTDRATILLDRAARYVGIHSPDSAPVCGSAQQFAVKLLKPDGSPEIVDADLPIAFYRENWNQSWTVVNGRYSCRSTRQLERITADVPGVVRVHDGVGTFKLLPTTAGQFAVAVTDPQTARVVSASMLVTGDAWTDSVSQEHPESLSVNVLPRPRFSGDAVNRLLSPNVLRVSPLDSLRSSLLADPPADGSEFKIGEPVRVMVRSPFAGTLLLTLETDHVLRSQVVEMTGSSTTVPMLLDCDCGPNAFVSASVVRAINPHVAWRVHRASGIAPIKIDERAHLIKIAIQSPALIRPEQSLPVAVRLTDADGNPLANAAVTIAVADEGICQLTHFITPDPFAYFTRWRQLGVSTNDTYAALMPDTDRSGDIGGDGEPAGLDARHSSPVSARRVRSLAMVSDLLHSDADGMVRADFPLPPFVGKARVMVASFSKDQFGSSEQFVTVRSDLVVQSSWPRFAAPGDRFHVPLIIFNNSSIGGDAIVHVHVDPHAPLSFASDSSANAGTKEFDLPPVHIDGGKSLVTSFDAIAAAACGVTDVRTDVTLGSETFHETISLPVRPASPTITTSGARTLLPGDTFSFVPPGGMLDGQSTFSLHVLPKPTLNLPQGLDYLDRYPYGCAEQTISVAFPQVYLPDLGEMLAGGAFQRDGVAEKVRVAFDRLVMMQARSGALPMWPGGNDWPWVSIYGAHFCVVAERAGLPVPADFRDRLLNYVNAQLAVSSDDPSELERQAYACYVLALDGKPDVNAMSRLSDLLMRPSMPDVPPPTAETAFQLAAAWIAANDPAQADRLLPRLNFNPRTSRDLSGNVGSPVRERAIMLSTLLSMKPDHPQIPAIAAALADAGRRGEWRSTQDVAFAVMALGQYAQQTREEKPFSHAELWCGDRKLASADDGAPLTWKTDAGQSTPTGTFTVRLDGPPHARGYVDWLSDGIPLHPQHDAVSAGMEIERRYLDESKNSLTGAIHSGQLLDVELTLKCPQALDGVVIEDLLPAGLEPENPRLSSSRSEGQDDQSKTDDFPANRQDFRDDRVVLFGNVERPGTFHCNYLVRAVTAGVFAIPPVRAECMYDLATHALGAGGATLTVEQRSGKPVVITASAGNE